MLECVHVMPRGDLVHHDEDESCVCHPKSLPHYEGNSLTGWIVVHNSLDGREFSEGHDVAPRKVVKDDVAIEFLREATVVLSIGSFLMGLFIVVGGRQAWSDTLYNTALLFPGAPQSLGAIVLVFGLLMMIGTSRWVHRPLLTCLGSYGTGIWCMFFAVVLGKEWLGSGGKVSAISVVTFGTAAVIYLLVADTHRKRNLERDANHPQQGSQSI